jgi:hypothetical protein
MATNGRIYSAIFNAVAVSAQQDLFEINAAAAKPVEILGLFLSQSSEIGDAQEEGLNILIKTGATTSGSTGGTAPTAVPRVFGDTAFGGNIEINNTVKASAGTIVIHEAWNWNVRVPFQFIWTPEATIILGGGGRMTVELATTPADVITMSGTIWFNELG